MNKSVNTPGGSSAASGRGYMKSGTMSGSMPSSAGAGMSPEDIEEAVQLMKAIELEEKAKEVKFKFVNDLNKLYEVGDDVIPSDNGRSSVKAVVFAKSTETGRTVIIKQRNKAKSFKDEQEVNDWVFNMKLLYYITGPEDGSHRRRPQGGRGHKDADAMMNKVSNTTVSTVATTGVHRDRIDDCSHISRVLDILEDQKYYYVVMEYVKGRDLFEYFIQEKTYERSYTVDIARALAKDLCVAIEKLHELAIVHRDVKLENVVLDEALMRQEGAELRCACKIIDFDTCELYRPGNRAFHVLGTDQYIAPETYAGYAGPAADMWAIGVILYIILTGSFPFHYAIFDDQPGENYVGHPRMDQIRRRLRIAKIDWSHKVWLSGSGPKAKDFVRRCFIPDQRKRMRVQDALTHMWIEELRDPKARTQSSTALAGTAPSTRKSQK